MFVGYVRLGDALVVPVLFSDAGHTPTNLDALPTARVYGPEGRLASAAATASLLDAGAVEGATDATPVVVTSAGHGLSDGTLVTVAGVLGNAGANGTFRVRRLTADTFELLGSAGDGAYESGGTWNVAGLYRLALVASEAHGFEAGRSYTAVVRGRLAGVDVASAAVFVVT